MKPGKTGLARIIAAVGYSMKGLRAAWQHEAAFRQEVLLAIVLIPLAFFVGQTTLEVIVLVISVVLIVMCELVNSAIEATVDRFGGEQHELSGRAKDIGSALVFVSIGLCLFVWLMLLYRNFIVS